MDPHYQRALVLLEQSRYDLAEQELRQALAADPDHAAAHAQLALCLSERDEFAQATEEARTAIRLAPEWPVAYSVLAQTLAQRNRFGEAADALREALRLDPADPDHYALLAGVRMAQRDWPAALDAAERGLQQDAEHVGCNNYRAMALTKLGRTAEAGATMAATLARDPEDPVSHANQGWTCLHENNPKQALEHFREALRLDPTSDYARAGMVEALKARNPIYGLMLRYFLWMNRLSGGAQWAVIIGLYVVYRFLGGFANQNPEWAPFVRPLLVAYVVFALMTWLAVPLFNLLLRLSRYGRYALSRDQTWGANVVALLGVPALVCLALWLAADHDLAFLGAIYFGFLLLPASAIFNCERGWPRTGMVLYTAVMAALLPASLFVAGADPQLARFLVQAHLLGTFLSAFVANFLMASQPQR